MTAPSENLIGRFRAEVGGRRFERAEAVAWVASTGRGEFRAARIFRLWLKRGLVVQEDANGYRFVSPPAEPPEARTLRWMGRARRLIAMEPAELELVRRAAAALLAEVEGEIARR